MRDRTAAQPNRVTVFRIYDPLTERFYYTSTGDSVFLVRKETEFIKSTLHRDVKKRAEIREYYLVPVSEEE